MNDGSSASPRILLTMTAVTGVVDAVSFLAMGHVFTANMTGNIVLLGFAFAGAAEVSISHSLFALIGFLAGAVVGGRMALNLSSRRSLGRALLLEALLLAFGAALAVTNPLQQYGVIGSVAVAMGIQNAVVRKLGVPDLTTTVLTMTVTGLAADSSFAGGENPRWQRRTAAIATMIAGAAAGARMVARSTWFPLAVCSVVTAACVIAQRRIDSKRS